MAATIGINRPSNAAETAANMEEVPRSSSLKVERVGRSLAGRIAHGAQAATGDSQSVVSIDRGEEDRIGVAWVLFHQCFTTSDELSPTHTAKRTNADV